MNATRLLMPLAHFSAIAEPVARTAHFAAVSYLSYRRGEYARARAEMVEALRETDRISDLIGDNAVLSARRVHLLHNIMKLDAASGSAAEVPRIGLALLRYLAEGPEEWPSGFGRGPETSPDPLDAEHQSNKIVETIAKTVEVFSDKECRAYCVEAKRLLDCPKPPSPRAWAWLSLKRWQFEGRAEEFLREAAAFLSGGPGAMPNPWYAVALDVLVFYREHEPEEARTATKAMVMTLATSAAVPSFVRDYLAQGAQSPAAGLDEPEVPDQLSRKEQRSQPT